MAFFVLLLIAGFLFFFFRILCKKHSWVTSGVFGFARAIERFGVERYKLNSAKVQWTTPALNLLFG